MGDVPRKKLIWGRNAKSLSNDYFSNKTSVMIMIYIYLLFGTLVPYVLLLFADFIIQHNYLLLFIYSVYFDTKTENKRSFCDD